MKDLLMQKDIRLGSLLMAQGNINAEQLRFALACQKTHQNSANLGQILIDLRYISRPQLAYVLGKQFLLSLLLVVTATLFASFQPVHAKPPKTTVSKAQNRGFNTNFGVIGIQQRIGENHDKAVGIEDNIMFYVDSVNLTHTVDVKALGAQLGGLIWGYLDENNANPAPSTIGAEDVLKPQRHYQEQVKLKLEFSYSPDSRYQIGFGNRTVTIGMQYDF